MDYGFDYHIESDDQFIACGWAETAEMALAKAEEVVTSHKSYLGIETVIKLTSRKANSQA